MEEIIFSPELTGPDTLVLQNLADDIHRHKKLKGASSNTDRDEGYCSTNSAAQESVVCTWLASFPELPLRAYVENQMTDIKAKH